MCIRDRTTFTRAVCRAFEEEGFRMIGTSTSQVATDNLKTEAGIEAHNATSLIHQLNSNTLTLTSKDVLVIDEGGMFGAKNYNAIATYAETVSYTHLDVYKRQSPFKSARLRGTFRRTTVTSNSKRAKRWQWSIFKTYHQTNART